MTAIMTGGIPSQTSSEMRSFGRWWATPAQHTIIKKVRENPQRPVAIPEDPEIARLRFQPVGAQVPKTVLLVNFLRDLAIFLRGIVKNRGYWFEVQHNNHHFVVYYKDEIVFQIDIQKKWEQDIAEILMPLLMITHDREALKAQGKKKQPSQNYGWSSQFHPVVDLKKQKVIVELNHHPVWVLSTQKQWHPIQVAIIGPWLLEQQFCTQALLSRVTGQAPVKTISMDRTASPDGPNHRWTLRNGNDQEVGQDEAEIHEVLDPDVFDALFIASVKLVEKKWPCAKPYYLGFMQAEKMGIWHETRGGFSWNAATAAFAEVALRACKAGCDDLPPTIEELETEIWALLPEIILR